MRRTVLCLALACLAALGAGSAEARRPAQAESAVERAVAGQFDYYVLALSWSPTYCLTRPADADQCGNKGLGLVLHGLWPQHTAGGYPERCASDHRVTSEARRFGNTIFPSRKLVDHEWSKHGTCSGLDALRYFKAADEARTRLKVPPAFESPVRTQALSAQDIAAAFVSANPGMPADSIAVVCRGPQFQELRVCLDRTLNPRACGRGVRSACRRGEVRVPALR